MCLSKLKNYTPLKVIEARRGAKNGLWAGHQELTCDHFNFFPPVIEKLQLQAWNLSNSKILQHFYVSVS